MSVTVEPVAHDLAELPPSSRHTPLQPPRIVPPPDTRSGPAGDSRLATLVVFAIVLGAGVLAITPHPLGVFSDDGMYAVLARSLAEGKGYRFINLPGSPSGTHFPPAYPLLLAALWKLFPAFPQNVLVFKGANVLLNAVAAALAFRFGERVLALPRWAAALTALMAGIAIPSLLLAGMVMSEPLFLVLLLGALMTAERVRATPTVRGAIAVGALGGVLMLTRSIGIAFVVGSVVALLVARRWRHAAIAAAVAVALAAPWQLWVARHDGELPPVLRGKYGSYAGWMSRGVAAHGSEFLVRTVATNVETGARMTLTPLRPPRVPLLVPFVMLAGVVCTVVGCRRLARRAPVTFLVLGAYVSVVLLWPFDPTRFLWGIWPLLMLLVASTVAELWPLARGTSPAAPTRPALRLTSRALSVAGVACGLLLALGATYYTAIVRLARAPARDDGAAGAGVGARRHAARRRRRLRRGVDGVPLHGAARHADHAVHARRAHLPAVGRRARRGPRADPRPLPAGLGGAERADLGRRRAAAARAAVPPPRRRRHAARRRSRPSSKPQA
jgi:hypothetical protein